MRWYQLFGIFIIIAIHGAEAQSVAYYIDPPTFNAAYFTDRVLAAINERRRGLPEVGVDSLLSSAAKDQVLYLAKVKGTGTIQKGDTRKITTAKRVAFYGGKHAITGELTAQTTVQQPVNDFASIRDYYHVNATYEQTARNIICQWIQSASSRKILLDKHFRSAGIAVSIDPLTWDVYVVATFGNNASVSHSDQIADIPDDTLKLALPNGVSRYTYGFKPPKLNPSLRKAQRWSKALPNNRVVSDYLVTSWRTARRNFRWWHRKTGLAFERDSIVISSEQSFHSSPSRLDQNDLYKKSLTGFMNARTVRHISRETYYSMYKKEHIRILGITTPFYRQPSQFIFPVGMLGDFDNLLVIRKKRLCDIIRYEPVPSLSFDPQPIIIPYQSLSGGFFGTEKRIVLSDTIVQRFFYERNETKPDTENFDEAVSRIPVDRLVREIRLEAHASIEGSQQANVELYNKRAAMVKTLLQQNNLVTNDLKISVAVSENWEMFYEQISGNLYEGLASKDRPAIRNFVNQHKNDTIMKQWLDEQRFSNVFLVLNLPQKNPITTDSLAQKFHTLLHLPLSAMSNQMLMNIYRMQWSFYQRIEKEKHPERFSSLTIPDEPLWASLRFNEVMFRWKAGLLDEPGLFAALQKIGQERTVMPPLYSRLIFNNTAWLLNHYFWYCDMNKSIPEGIFFDIEKRNYLLYFKKYKTSRRKNLDKRPEQLIMLDYLPQIISDLSKFGEHSGIQRQLREFYLVSEINAYQQWSRFRFRGVIRNLITDLWNNHVTRAKLSDEDRIRWTLYFNQFNDFSKAGYLLSPLVKRAIPHHEGLRLWISLLAHQQDRAAVVQAIIDAKSVLTKHEWVELTTSGKYISRNYREDYRVRTLLIAGK